MAGYARRIKKGTTSHTVVARVYALSSTPVPATSVSEGTAGLVVKYWRHGVISGNAFDVSVVAVSLTDLSASWNSGGIKHVADGWYRLDVPDAAFAIGANAVLVTITGTNLYSDGALIELFDFNPQTNNAQSTPEKY